MAGKCGGLPASDNNEKGKETTAAMQIDDKGDEPPTKKQNTAEMINFSAWSPHTLRNQFKNTVLNDKNKLAGLEKGVDFKDFFNGNKTIILRGGAKVNTAVYDVSVLPQYAKRFRGKNAVVKVQSGGNMDYLVFEEQPQKGEFYLSFRFYNFNPDKVYHTTDIRAAFEGLNYKYCRFYKFELEEGKPCMQIQLFFESKEALQKVLKENTELVFYFPTDHKYRSEASAHVGGFIVDKETGKKKFLYKEDFIPKKKEDKEN